MKGIIFNLLEGVVRNKYGEETWAGLLDAAGLEGAYTSLGNYPDADLTKLVVAAAAALKLPPNQIIRWFGVNALPLLAGKYPKFFMPHSTTRSFVLSVNSIIHPEVRKLYPGAYVPEFEFDNSSPEVLVMIYRSTRKLCALAEGFVEGAATHFGERATMEHPQCMHRRDEKCVLRFSFQKLEATSHV